MQLRGGHQVDEVPDLGIAIAAERSYGASNRHDPDVANSIVSSRAPGGAKRSSVAR